MLSKRYFPLCWRCVGWCLSYAIILYVSLLVITTQRVSDTVSPSILENNGHFVYR